MSLGIALTYRRGLRAPLGLEPSTRLSAALSVVELGPHAVELAVELGGVFLVVVHLDTEGHGREVQHVVIGAGLAYRGQVHRRPKCFGFNLRGVHLGVPFCVFVSLWLHHKQPHKGMSNCAITPPHKPLKTLTFIGVSKPVIHDEKSRVYTLYTK